MHSRLYDLSSELVVKLIALTDLPLYDNSEKLVVSDIACSMSMEHWRATLQLLGEGFFPSAAVVHRSQFEALLRSVWALYSASSSQLAKLNAALTVQAEQEAKNLPLVADMMAAIEKTAPPNAFDALNRFKVNSWKALNSYVHAGIHPLRRHADGYPRDLLEAVAKNANGLGVMAAMQSVVLAGAQPLQRDILNLAAQYPECMPQPL